MITRITSGTTAAMAARAATSTSRVRSRSASLTASLWARRAGPRTAPAPTREPSATRSRSQFLDGSDLDQELLRPGRVELHMGDTLGALPRHLHDASVAEVGVTD